MDQRDDYAELTPPTPLVDPGWWHGLIRNLLLVVGLIAFALFLAGVAVVRVVEMRGTRLPKMPTPNPDGTFEPVCADAPRLPRFGTDGCEASSERTVG
jgi:hypothetical protein